MDEEFAKRVGRRIKIARAGRGISAADLARRCGLNTGTLSRMEHGLQVMRADRIVVICQELGVSADWLLGLDDTVPDFMR